MFSGIVEAQGIVREVIPDGGNLHFVVSCPFTHELKIDQSLAHNGACLTVVEIEGDHYKVTAISETLRKTNLARVKAGDILNLERCMRLNDRLDGHMVQGHVDTTAICTSVTEENGSWKYAFTYQPSSDYITVAKGSICVNGVSLTVVDSMRDGFSVCIIPYTHEHTNFRILKPGDEVNLEFDIIGKYIARYLSMSAGS